MPLASLYSYQALYKQTALQQQNKIIPDTVPLHSTFKIQSASEPQNEGPCLYWNKAISTRLSVSTAHSERCLVLFYPSHSVHALESGTLSNFTLLQAP